VKHLWTWRTIDAPASVVWDILTDHLRWPDWGPSLRSAHIDGGVLELGATGTVTTAVGIDLRFTVTEFEPGRRWAWSIAGIGATDHIVEPVAAGGSRAGFGVPIVVAPYLAVCRVALARIDRIATAQALPGQRP